MSVVHLWMTNSTDSSELKNSESAAVVCSARCYDFLFCKCNATGIVRYSYIRYAKNVRKDASIWLQLDDEQMLILDMHE